MANKPIVMLSLDGGGARGALAAELLRLFEYHLDINVYESFDFFTGVSTGAIIAAYCAGNTNDMAFLANSVYSSENLSRVFDKTIWDRLMGRMQTRPKYDGVNKAQHFARLFGDSRINDIDEKKLLILAYDFINREITVFKNGYTPYNPTLREVCNAATAAPTLYPPEATSEPRCRWLIDGAVATNDPSMIGVAEALAMGYALEDIWMVSVGTGKPVHDLDQKQQNAIGAKARHWGTLEWVANGLFDHMMLGSSSVSEHQCRQLLGDRYLRINGFLPRALLQLDNTDEGSVGDLRSHAFEWFEECGDQVLDLLRRVNLQE